MKLRVGQATRAMAGQLENGDAAWQKQDSSLACLALVDGLGHGHEALHASQACCEALEASFGQGVEAQIRHCHQSLGKTRGAALTLAHLDLDSGRLRWAGVGNVEALWVGKDGREKLLLKNGIVGYNLPELRVSEKQLEPGDLLVMASDGIRPDFSQGLQPGQDPQALASAILEQYGRGNDDALVVAGLLLE